MIDKYILRCIAEAACERLMQEIDKANAENTRLKAEVERLTSQLDQAERDNDNCQKRKVSIDNHRFYIFMENKSLQAEVERLRKAGDELSNALAAFHLIHRGKIDTTTQPDIVAWNAAKEGKSRE